LKNYQKKSAFLILFGLSLNIYNIHSQTNNNTSLYNWFDTTLGKQNLDINNGALHTNPYKTLDNNTIYFDEDVFTKGTLTFEGQTYYDTALKYDIYRDILILNPYGASEHIGISLVTEKVDAFSLYNRNFVKLKKGQYDLPNFTTGYYETSESNENFVFYIKHSKLMQKIVKEDGIFYKFKRSNNYLLAYNQKLYTVNNKSEIIKIFPDKKKQINEFYIMNREVKKSDLNKFMTNLMKFIYSSLSNQNN